MLRPPLVFGFPDTHFLEIAERFPDFAGAYVRQGKLQVLSKSGKMPPGLSKGPTDLPVEVQTAKWGWRERASMHRTVYEALIKNSDGAYWLDIDETRNRIVAGVPNVSDARQLLAQQGIPPGMVLLQESRPPVPTSHTLLDSVRPLVGGLHTNLSSVGFCTFSFNVDHWRYGNAFVLPSHCTGSFAEFDGAIASQLTVKIGTEVFDQRSRFENSACPSGHICRWADAALFQMEGDVPFAFEIANVTQEDFLVIDHNDPSLAIDEEELTLFDGQELIWIGRTSGQSTGTINKTCFTVTADFFDNTSQTVTLWCQFKHTNGGVGGDSGSPIYSPISSIGAAELAGLVWGVEEDITGDDDSYFSPIEGIRRDLRPDSTLTCNGLLTTVGGGCGEEASGGSSGDSGDDDDCLDTAIFCN